MPQSQQSIRMSGGRRDRQTGRFNTITDIERHCPILLVYWHNIKKVETQKKTKSLKYQISLSQLASL